MISGHLTRKLRSERVLVCATNPDESEQPLEHDVIAQKRYSHPNLLARDN